MAGTGGPAGLKPVSRQSYAAHAYTVNRTMGTGLIRHAGHLQWLPDGGKASPLFTTIIVPRSRTVAQATCPPASEPDRPRASAAWRPVDVISAWEATARRSG